MKSYDFLKWNPDDDRALVLFIRDADGQAVASLRAILLHANEELETLFDIRLNSAMPLPILAMDRLVILSSQRGKGLSSVFRCCLYGACTRSEIMTIAFTINEGLSRIPFQKKLGYQFEPADISHRSDSPYDNEGGILLAHLEHNSFKQAYEVSSENLIVDLATVSLQEGFNQKVEQYLSLS